MAGPSHDLSVNIGSYEKDGQTKYRSIKIGAMFQGEYGPFIVLEPHVDLSGVLMLQRALLHKQGKQLRDSVMVNCWSTDRDQSRGSSNSAPAQAPAPSADYADDIPF